MRECKYSPGPTLSDIHLHPGVTCRLLIVVVFSFFPGWTLDTQVGVEFDGGHVDSDVFSRSGLERVDIKILTVKVLRTVGSQSTGIRFHR